jgi:uncharacterized membrane protein
MNNVQRLTTLKEQHDKAKEIYQQAKAARDFAIKQLNDAGYNTPEEAKQDIDKKANEIVEWDQKIGNLLAQAEKQLNG